MEYSVELKSKIKNLADQYGAIAVRVQSRPFELGRIDHISHRWDDGEDTGEELGGIGATSIKMLDYVCGEYFGDHVALLDGDIAEYGEDAGEVVLKNAEVVCIIA